MHDQRKLFFGHCSGRASQFLFANAANNIGAGAGLRGPFESVQ